MRVSSFKVKVPQIGWDKYDLTGKDISKDYAINLMELVLTGNDCGYEPSDICFRDYTNEYPVSQNKVVYSIDLVPVGVIELE